MSVDVFSWNVRDSFSREEDARRVIGYTKELMPTVAIFPEAYTEGETHLLDDVTEDFDRAGYDLTHGLYNDIDGRSDRHGLLSIIHRSAAQPDKPGTLVSLGDRNAIEQWPVDLGSDQEIHFIGAHLNDRSSALRSGEVKAVLSLLDAATPVILAGDFNEMHSESARGLKISVGHIINRLVELGLLPVRDPESINDSLSLARIGSLGQRLHDMSLGQQIAVLVEAGFIDADPTHQPTMPSDKPFAQLDHIMHTDRLEVARFELLPHYGKPFDHRGIISTLGGLATK